MIDDILLPYSPQILRALLQCRASVYTCFIKHDPKMSFNLFLRSNVSLNSDEAMSYFGLDLLWSTRILKFCSVPLGKGNGHDSEINAQCTLSLTNWNIVFAKIGPWDREIKSHIKYINVKYECTDEQYVVWPYIVLMSFHLNSTNRSFLLNYRIWEHPLVKYFKWANCMGISFVKIYIPVVIFLT